MKPRKMDQESRDWLVNDELPRERSCILAGVDDAEKKELYRFAVWTSRFYSIIENGEIQTTIDSSSWTSDWALLDKTLKRMGVERPADEYLCYRGSPGI
nr:hypothetical protein [uncultured Methanoregula sp.]